MPGSTSMCRPVRVTVSLSGFFADEIPYRGLTLIRTLS